MPESPKEGTSQICCGLGLGHTLVPGCMLGDPKARKANRALPCRPLPSGFQLAPFGSLSLFRLSQLSPPVQPASTHQTTPLLFLSFSFLPLFFFFLFGGSLTGGFSSPKARGLTKALPRLSAELPKVSAAWTLSLPLCLALPLADGCSDGLHWAGVSELQSEGLNARKV